MNSPILKKCYKQLNKVIFRNSSPRLIQPVPDFVLARYYVDSEQQKKNIRSHLNQVGKRILPNKRPRIFVAVRHVNWEMDNLVSPWSDLGDVEHYDWGETYDQYDPQWSKKKRVFCEELLEKVKAAHQKVPIDIFFSYLSGNWIYPDVIAEIGKLGIITINFSFDDKLKFWGSRTEHGLTGNAEIAPLFDLCITCQSSHDVSKYVYVGANPLFMHPAANPATINHDPVEKDIKISFIGQRYGVRPKIIEALLNNGIPVTVYGLGWPSGELDDRYKQEILSRSQINLGFGYVDHYDDVIGLKERDFEVPLAGGLYITTHNPDLATCYAIGDEIDTYRNTSELINKLKDYLSHPDRVKTIGTAGRERVLRDHTWQKRFASLLNLLYENKSVL